MARYHERRDAFLDEAGRRCGLCGSEYRLTIVPIDPAKNVDTNVWLLAADQYAFAVLDYHCLCSACSKVRVMSVRSRALTPSDARRIKKLKAGDARLSVRLIAVLIDKPNHESAIRDVVTGRTWREQ